ncbi:hypothetical protein MRB53_025430 [Persea americana]|uniref:Uncharacterized protein n=1 Tax=Persea americana TaxID=3435 RepID=A0ACC2LF82_PERAE|nr:hypothetical protein MRB53_025430 [Persea americana]
MAGSVGSDPLGGFYRAKLRRANVDFLSVPVNEGTTGTVIVLTTPDAQHTMLAYQVGLGPAGTSSSVNYDPCLANIIAKTNILVIEGYLFEFPHTAKAIMEACEDAHKSGALIAVTASDVSCIERCYDYFWEILGNHADIVFANSDEARAFCQLSSMESPISATSREPVFELKMLLSWQNHSWISTLRAPKCFLLPRFSSLSTPFPSSIPAQITKTISVKSQAIDSSSDWTFDEGLDVEFELNFVDSLRFK